MIDVGARLARRLERGEVEFAGAAAVERIVRVLAGARLARPLDVPSGVRVVAVGGATLGGSGKTPVAIEVARLLSARGERVAFVGHAYGAKPGRARLVAPDDDVREVGDEALVVARALGDGVPVVVAPSRGEATAFAARRAEVVVIDGALQISPARAFRSLLVVDAASPWGSGRCLPRGDLRAQPSDLLAACDLVVAIGDAPPMLSRPVVRARSILEPTALLDGAGVPLASLRSSRVGFVASLGRPERVLAALAAHGIRPERVLRLRDHALPRAWDVARAARLVREHRLSAWIATEKCATRLPSPLGGAPVAALRHHVAFDADGPRADAISGALPW